jgi:pyruvate kinase
MDEAVRIVNAILDGTDAVMLSGETAIGRYPVETVRMMRRIADQAERALPNRPPRASSGRQAVQQALAEETRAKALVVFTQSGFTAHLLSSAFPLLPLIALTEDEAVYRRMALWWGPRPIRTGFARTMDATTATFQETLVAEGRSDRHRRFLDPHDGYAQQCHHTPSHRTRLIAVLFVIR